MAEFYDDYLGSYDQESSVPVMLRDRTGAWSQSSYASQSNSRGVPNSLYSRNGRSMRRKNPSHANPRAFTRAQNDYEGGYGSEEYDDGSLELTMIRVKVCNIPLIFW